MKTNKYIFRPPRRGIGIMILMILGCMSLFAQQLQFTKPFDFTIGQNFFIEEKTDENGTFVHLKHNDMDKTGVVGAPELPVEYVRISVPYNAVNIQITATRTVSRTLSLGRYVYPVQESVPIGQEITFTQPDPSIYSQSTLYPNKVAEIVGVGFFDGCNQVVTVALYPTEFSPTNRSLRLSSKITFQLRFNITSPSNMPTPPVIPRWRNSEKIDMLKSMVINPESVLPFAPTTPQNKPSQSTATNPIYDYVIVTADSLRPAFDRFVAWKRQKGYNVKVEAIENILSSTTYANGDEVSGINDDAGKLRAYLRQCYINNGTEFVLLAGDYTIMPIRYALTGSNNLNERHVPTDLYFSEINSSWDKNKNMKYGELSDSISYAPELYVGRLLCSTAEHIKSYTTKLLQYELYPGRGNKSYLNNAFISQASELQEIDNAGRIKSAFGDLFNNVYIFGDRTSIGYYGLNESSSGTSMITELNKNYGYISVHGHGNPAGIKTQEIGAFGINAKRGVSYYLQEWSNSNSNSDVTNGLNNLKNFDSPAIMYSIACSTTPFDIYTENSTIYDVEYNMGSSFTCGGAYGGPAYLGNTSVGYYGDIISSVQLEECFVYSIKSGIHKLGKAEAISKQIFSQFASLNDEYLNEKHITHHIILSHNLIGDPEFEMWTKSPQNIFDSCDITLQRTNNGISLRNINLNSSKYTVGMSYVNSVQQKSSNYTGFYLPSPPNSIITIYSTNYLPYILPTKFQNDVINEGKHHFITGEISIGENVDSNRTSGQFVIANGVEITIEAMGNVEISKGFIIESGGIVNIKSAENITFTGGIVMSGAILNVEGRKISASQNLIVKKGGCLNINKD